MQKTQKNYLSLPIKRQLAVKGLEKQSGKTYGRFQQGAIGTANATKSFSKLNQTIGGGGSGGAGALVGAYAVLAANIFAVTAAFNAFRGAAGVDKLTEGLEAFSNTTGQSLDLVARDFKKQLEMRYRLNKR